MAISPLTIQDNPILEWLFETQAVRVCEPDAPFWYTSGTLGPYYINTHFLYGSQTEAEQLLSAIEQAVLTPLDLPATLAALVGKQELHNRIFHHLMDVVTDTLRNESFDLISGGERRDFFFSIPVALRLDKPHLTILKNGRSFISEPGLQKTHEATPAELAGRTVLHVADLVTEASSYIRAWLPAVQKVGAHMKQTLAIIDRDQGGREILASAGIQLLSLARIEPALFDLAARKNLISPDQAAQIQSFMCDPHQFMHDFFRTHPHYLADQLALGSKAAERAQRCLDLGYGTV